MLEVIMWGGLVTSVLVSLVIFPTYIFCPKIWLAEISRGKEKHNSALAIAVTLLVVVILLAGATASAVSYATGNEITFLQRFLIAWGVIALFSLYDLIVIDILFYMWVHPPFMRFEGYPRLGYWHHTKASLKGAFLPVGMPLAVISALISLLF
ncbi:MAG: hypothetical protein AAGC95_03825 [Pseudomonadota bacterium]